MDAEDARSIGARARMIRRRRGLSLDVVAGLAGITKQYLSALERGLRGFNRRGQFAHVSNTAFRLIKASTPGSYTFILPATKEVPRRLLRPRKKTIGIRIPQHAVAQALLAELGPVLVAEPPAHCRRHRRCPVPDPGRRSARRSAGGGAAAAGARRA